MCVCLTKGGRIEGGPTINDTVIACDDGLIDAITNEQDILLVFRNKHIFFIISFSNIDKEVSIFWFQVSGDSRNGFSNGGEVISPIMTHNCIVVQ